MAEPIDFKKDIEYKRMQIALCEIFDAGYEPEQMDDHEIQFEFKGSTVRFYPFSGWATGKTIRDGRGIKKLIEQIRIFK